MCAQFELEKSMFTEKMKKLNLDIIDFNLNQRVLPHTKSPVLIKNENTISLKAMNFSLIPWWSKDKKPKFSTHNARLETIKEKPTWKNIFGKKHCLVPMTSFIEPIYTGEYAGHMIKFILNECIFVPALFDTWSDKGTGEVIESFAVLTSVPVPFVEQYGHDRSPVFLNQEKVFKWLDVAFKNDEFFYDILKQKYIPEFSIDIERKLKKGWEKRI